MYRFLAVFVLLAVLVNAGCQKKTPDMLSCDDLAAHPEDKDKVGAGKADNSIDVELAIKQCSAAVEQNPQVARFQFQLGRAFWAGKRYDEALDALLKADEQGYTPADFYIGQAYEQGLVEGEAPDIGLARDLYMIAASDGFPPAARAFQDIEENDEVDFSGFSRPALAKSLYEGGDFSVLTKERFAALGYIQGVQDFVELDPNQYDASCKKLSDPTVSQKIAALAPDPTKMVMQGGQAKGVDQLLNAFGATMRQAQQISAARQAGTDDMYALVANNGGCDGAATTQFYGNIKKYLQQAGSRTGR